MKVQIEFKTRKRMFKMLWIYLIGFFAIANAVQDDRQKPILQEILVPRKLVESQIIRLNCDLIQGAKPIRFSWFFNDEPIRESERMEIETRKDASSLMIRELSVNNVGRYKCVASNDYGSDQQQTMVHVNSKRVRL